MYVSKFLMKTARSLGVTLTETDIDRMALQESRHLIPNLIKSQCYRLNVTRKPQVPVTFYTTSRPWLDESNVAWSAIQLMQALFCCKQRAGLAPPPRDRSGSRAGLVQGPVLPLMFFIWLTAMRRIVSLSGLRASVEHVGTMSHNSFIYVVILFLRRRSISQCDSLEHSTSVTNHRVNTGKMSTATQTVT